MMYDRLQSDGYTVSFDMDTLKNGNFNEELLKRVAECKNFVIRIANTIFRNCKSSFKQKCKNREE